MIIGKHLIAGQWTASDKTFTSNPVHGSAHAFSEGTPSSIATACEAAADAFYHYGYTSRPTRAAFLNSIADEMEMRRHDISEITGQETGLPATRINNEIGRTTGQLRFFAAHIVKDSYVNRHYDEALPDRQPLPRSSINCVQRPIGPVAVFGASNFPLAFSTAGGDTAAALAAGCPVIVKGHPAHPGCGEYVAQAIDAAIKKHHLPAGIFSLIQGKTIEVGQALVQNPHVQAVGFTGSLRGGRALFNLCAARPTPIPFFGEMGSINPVFLLPQAVKTNAVAIAKQWVASLTLGVGQFCTNPGVVIVIVGAATDQLQQAAVDSIADIEEQTMLTEDIAHAYQSGVQRLKDSKNMKTLFGKPSLSRQALPWLFETTADQWLANPELQEEVFGPSGILVKARDFEQMKQIAKTLDGQLTCTLHTAAGDSDMAQQLIPYLENKAGRLLVNGFPTGVEVCDAMVHGGPYPASTNFGATAVGTLAINRFLRLVAYQNFPDDLLPLDCRSSSTG